MRVVAVVLLAVVASAFAQTASLCTTVADLRVRTHPSTEGEILRFLPKGARVNVIQKGDGWALIGKDSYVSARYLDTCASDKPTTKATAKATTKPTKKVTAKATTRATKKTTTKATKKATSKATIKPRRATTKATTKATKKATTKPTKKATTKATQKAAQKPAAGALTLQQLRAIMPRLSSSKANSYINYLSKGMQEAGVNTCPRKAAFLAQLAHESGQLNWFEEFASGAAYEGRRDLGNTQPGDGRRFKGRGPIQLTGRNNYAAAGRALGLNLIANPKSVATPAVGFRTSLWFWNSRGLSKVADKNTQAAFDQITRRVNGGYNGKADRDQYWRKARKVLGC